MSIYHAAQGGCWDDMSHAPYFAVSSLDVPAYSSTSYSSLALWYTASFIVSRITVADLGT